MAVLMPFLMLGAAGGAATPPAGAVLCGAGGAQQNVNGVTLSAEQMANAQTIVTVTASRHLPSYAAIVALTTAYTESTLHNSSVESDHDSEGLFQQRISVYGKAVADDPVRSTNAFLDRLLGVPNWQSTPVGVDAQTVQISSYPDRYAPNQPLAVALTGILWPAAAAAATPPPTSSDTNAGSVAVPVVACGVDGANPSEGGHGNVVAGSPTIPAGLAITGSPAARKAVGYALAQLGKPYVFGAAGPDAFDCSGLTMAAWASAGVALPHLAAAQVGYGTPEPIDLSQADSGDLVMIPGSDGTAAAPGHVGMVIGRGGDGHLYLIQAPGWQNLPIEITDTTEWIGDVVDVRHIQ
ncbi:MAG TPA: NlpC/P60 family protein [Jatrophihabitantaceae bacterium]|jgi:cell wall-associated NlpC family hydrolase